MVGKYHLTIELPVCHLFLSLVFALYSVCVGYRKRSLARFPLTYHRLKNKTSPTPRKNNKCRANGVLVSDHPMSCSLTPGPPFLSRLCYMLILSDPIALCGLVVLVKNGKGGRKDSKEGGTKEGRW